MARRNVQANPTCSACGVALDSQNWTEAAKRHTNYICTPCHNAQSKNRYEEKVDVLRVYDAEYQHTHAEALRDYRVGYRQRKAAEDSIKYGHGDMSKVYYVYELYTILPNGREKVFYAGKGKNGRMLEHERIYRRKLLNPRSKMDAKEKMMLFLEDQGLPLLNRRVQSGLDEDSAFNLEREVILYHGLHNLTNVAHPRRPRRPPPN